MTEMMKINLRDAAKQGYVPDSTVCASEVPAGRPYPYMCLQNVINLGVSPVEACVKIDDTRPGVEEGLNGGMWTIGLAISGNEIGLSLRDWKRLPKADQERMRQGAYTRMYQMRRALRRRHDRRHPALSRRHRGAPRARRAAVRARPGPAREGAAPASARRRPRQLAAGSPLLRAARPCAPLLARNASAMSNAALVNFSTSANSSSDRRRAASLAR